MYVALTTFIHLPLVQSCPTPSEVHRGQYPLIFHANEFLKFLGFTTVTTEMYLYCKQLCGNWEKRPIYKTFQQPFSKLPQQDLQPQHEQGRIQDFPWEALSYFRNNHSLRHKFISLHSKMCRDKQTVSIRYFNGGSSKETSCLPRFPR